MNRTDTGKQILFDRIVQIAMAVLVLAVTIIFASGIATSAEDGSETSVNIIDINYNTSTITVAVNTQDTMLFLSNESQKKWEYIPYAVEETTYKINGDGEIIRDSFGNPITAAKGEAGTKTFRTVSVDISWISFSKNYAISFKGDYSEKPIKTILPKQSTTFRVTYDLYSSTVKVSGASEDQDIQWRKKDEIGWNDYDQSKFPELLQTFIDNGSSLYFRTAPINGTSEEDPGKRPSKEVALSIPKKTAAPTITVDDERLTLSSKKGLRYRYVDDIGRALSEWYTLNKDEAYPLSVIAAGAMYDAADAAKELKDVYIQFYQSATSTAQMSKRKTIKIPAQTLLTDSDISSENSILKFTGKTSFDMIFKTAGESNILEYCIITADMQKLGITINDITNENLKWNSVNTTAAISKSLSSDSKLVDNGLIYFRRKAQNKLGDTNYKLASPAVELGMINYPQGASIEGFTLLRTIDGMCKGGSNCLNFSFSSDTNGKIEKIEFRTVGGSAGTARFTYNVTENPGAPEGKEYTYNVSLNDLSDITEKNTLLFAYIYFTDNTSFEDASIKSDDENGIGLFIYTGTKINNPSGETETNEVAKKLDTAGNTYWHDYNYDNDSNKIPFTTTFKRVYNSNRTSGELEDRTSFRFKLDIGSKDNPIVTTKAAIDNCAEYETDSQVTVDKLSYDGIELVPEVGKEYFRVEYYTDTKTVDGTECEYTVAVVTVNADVIEKNTDIDDRDKDTPLYVYLSNGEVIKSGITLNLQRTATLTGAAAFSFTEGRLEAYKTKTEDGVTTTERKLEDYSKITLSVPSDLGGKTGYEVGVSTVAWNGTNILYSAEKIGNAITIILDSDLLNRIDVTDSETHDVVISFTNGYVIDSGIPMTISPASPAAP